MNYNKLIRWTKSDSATTLCRFTKSAIEQPKAPAIQQRKKGDSQTKNSQCKANMRDSKTNMHDSETNMRHSETKNCKTNQPNNKRIIQRIPIEQKYFFFRVCTRGLNLPPPLSTIPDRYSGLGDSITKAFLCATPLVTALTVLVEEFLWCRRTDWLDAS